jgi:hypothetical protein
MLYIKLIVAYQSESILHVLSTTHNVSAIDKYEIDEAVFVKWQGLFWPALVVGIDEHWVTCTFLDNANCM